MEGGVWGKSLRRVKMGGGDVGWGFFEGGVGGWGGELELRIF